MKVSYSDKLKDPRWQKKRLEILERDNFTCVCCFASDKTLHVHHCYYVSKREPWEYPGSSLLTLCEKCHKDVEDTESKAHAWATGWEFSVGAELDRWRSNGETDEGVLWSVAAAVHTDYPIPEAFNKIVDAANAGVITTEWLTRLMVEIRNAIRARKDRLKSAEEAKGVLV